MAQLIIFPSPLDSKCELRHDSGWVVLGVPAVHPTGRPGQSFEIPAGTPNGHGAKLVLTPTVSGRTALDFRGILFLKEGSLPWPWPADQTAALAIDDFLLPLGAGLPRLRLVGRDGFVTE